MSNFTLAKFVRRILFSFIILITFQCFGQTINSNTFMPAMVGCSGVASPSYYALNVSGSQLVSGITATAPSGFEVAYNGSSYGQTAVLPNNGSSASGTFAVRITANAPVGSLSGTLVLSSTNAANVNVSLTGTQYAIPTVTPGTVANVNSNSTSFVIPYTATGSSIYYDISATGPNPMPFFGNLSSQPLSNPNSGQVTIPIPKTSPGTYNFQLDFKTNGGCTSQKVPITLQVDPGPPSLTSSPTSISLNGCYGTTSGYNIININGSNLTANVVATAPAGIEISTDGINFSSTQTLVQSGGNLNTSLYARIVTSTSPGSFTGNISLNYSSSSPLLIGINATQNPSPSLNTGTIADVATNSTSFQIPFTLTGGVGGDKYDLSAASTNAMPGFTAISNQFIPNPPTGTITVPIPQSAAGTYKFLITPHATCYGPQTAVSLTVQSPKVSSAVSNVSLAACSNSPGSVTSFSIIGQWLTNDVSVNASPGFEISKDGSTFSNSLIFTQTGGNVNGQLYVRITSQNTPGNITGNLTLSSINATNYIISLSGTINAIPTVSVGTINSVNTNSTNFTIPFSSTGSVSSYDVVSGTPNPLPGFTGVSGSIPFSSGQIVLGIPKSSAGNYNFLIDVKGNGCSSSKVPFTLQIVPGPTVSGTPASLNIQGCVNAPGTSSSTTISGSNLTTNISVSAGTSIEISTNNLNFSSSLSLVPSSGSVSQIIYVRTKNTAASGSINDAVTLSSPDFTSFVIPVSATINSLPQLTLGSVSQIPSSATSFTLPYTVTGSATKYDIVSGSSNAMPSFVPVNQATLNSTSGQLTVTVPKSAPGSYNFVMDVTGTCSSSGVPFSVQVVPTPVLSSNVTAIAVNGCRGNTSNASNSFSITGNNLMDNITVTGPVSLEFSSDNVTFGSSATYSKGAGNLSATVFVRVASTANQGTISGNIVVSSLNATPINISVSGQQNGVPSVNVGIISPVGATSTSFTIPYTITGTASSFDLLPGTTNAMPGFTKIHNTLPNSGQLNIPIPQPAVGNYNFLLSVTGTCTSTQIPITLQVVQPTISVSYSQLSFTGCTGNSQSHLISVTGNHLTNDITVTAPNGFEISIDNSNFFKSVTITNNGAVFSSPVYVRIPSSTPGGSSFSGNLTFSSAGAVSQTTYLSATQITTPTVTLGALPSINTTATQIALPYSISGSATGYAIIPGSNPIPGLTAAMYQSLPDPVSGQIIISLPSNLNAGTYDYSIYVYDACTSTPIPFSIQITNAPPTIQSSVSSISIGSCQKDGSQTSYFDVRGTDLTSDLHLNPPSGFELTTDGKTFSSTLTLPAAGVSHFLQNIGIRVIASSAPGTYKGNLTLQSSGATDVVIPVSGSIIATGTVSLGTINSVSTNSTTFIIPYTITGNQTNLEVDASYINVMPGFNAVSGIAIDPSLKGSITVTIPPTNKGSYDFILYSYNGDCDPDGVYFTLNVTDQATVSTFSPTSAGTGTTVEIKGINFTGATAVTFGGKPAVSFTVVNDNLIRAVVGNGSSGDVIVTTANNGTATISGFIYNETLPVSFVYLKSNISNNKVMLQWQIEDASDCSKFDVERSTNGTDFSSIGTVDNDFRIVYNFTDEGSLKGYSYYRIKTESISGLKTIYSPVIKTANNFGTPLISVYPNPVTGKSFNISLTGFDEGTLLLQIVSPAGNTVMEKTIQSTTGTSNYEISLPPTSPAGTYTVRLLNDNKLVRTIQFIVLNK